MRTMGLARSGLAAGGMLVLLLAWVGIAEARGLVVIGQALDARTAAWEAQEAGRTWPVILVGIYCALIVAASWLGGRLPFLVRLTHTRMQVVISFVAGLMLGIGLFHMLPHAYAQTGSIDAAVRWAMVGLLTMFFLIRAFHFHQHGAVELLDEPRAHDHDHDEPHDHAGHGHEQRGHHHHHGHGAHRLSWVGVTLGLALHTLIDGVALGASVYAERGEPVLWSLFGVGTFLAILLHKPLDAVSITSLMTAGGWSASARNLVNVGFALMCPIGAGLFLLGADRLSVHQGAVVGGALAFAAGVFLCISLGDLLPEVEFHSHDRVKLSVALLAGVGLAYLIGFLEPAHSHDHGHRHSGRIEQLLERPGFRTSAGDAPGGA